MSTLLTRSSNDPYEMLLRYLDGALSDSEVDSLNGALKQDKALRREFALLLLQEVHLGEIGQEQRASEVPGDETAAASLEPVALPWVSVLTRAYAWVAAWPRLTALGLGVAVLIAALVLGRPDRPFLGKVDGDVLIQHGAHIVRAQAGAVLQNGDHLHVRSNAFASIKYRTENTLLQIGSASSLVLSSSRSGKLIHLEAGSLSAIAAPQPKTSPMRILTSEATATVLGTELVIQEQNRSTRLEVWSGRVRLTRLADGSAVDVGPGQTAAAGSGLPFKAQDFSRGVLREFWQELPGAEVRDLTGSARFPNEPTGRDLLYNFELTGHPGDAYGARLRAYLRPWRQGAYQFWIAADDSAELWLSPDDDPQHKILICQTKEWTGAREWDKSPEQTSIPLLLEAGRRYYIEALYKQNAGADCLAVAWRPPGGERGVVPREALVPAPDIPASEQVSIPVPANEPQNRP